MFFCEVQMLLLYFYAFSLKHWNSTISQVILKYKYLKFKKKKRILVFNILFSIVFKFGRILALDQSQK